MAPCWEYSLSRGFATLKLSSGLDPKFFFPSGCETWESVCIQLKETPDLHNYTFIGDQSQLLSGVYCLSAEYLWIPSCVQMSDMLHQPCFPCLVHRPRRPQVSSDSCSIPCAGFCAAPWGGPDGQQVSSSSLRSPFQESLGWTCTHCRIWSGLLGR